MSMNITWVLANDLILDPTVDIARMKAGGAFWGSWRTWRAYNTDNVICHDMKKAAELVKRSFHTTCNFYIPNSVYTELGRPIGTKLYEGNFMGHDVDHQDELVSMFLAGSQSDIVLLVGFDLTPPDTIDKIEELKARNHKGLFTQAIKSNPTVQWILVDYSNELPKELAELSNLGKDTLDNVFQILGG